MSSVIEEGRAAKHVTTSVTAITMYNILLSLEALCLKYRNATLFPMIPEGKGGSLLSNVDKVEI